MDVRIQIKAQNGYNILHLIPCDGASIIYNNNNSLNSEVEGFGTIHNYINGSTIDTALTEIANRIPTHGRAFVKFSIPQGTLFTNFLKQTIDDYYNIYRSQISYEQGIHTVSGLFYNGSQVYYTRDSGNTWHVCWENSSTYKLIFCDTLNNFIVFSYGNRLYLKSVYFDELYHPSLALNTVRSITNAQILPSDFTAANVVKIFQRNIGYVYYYYIFYIASSKLMLRRVPVTSSSINNLSSWSLVYTENSVSWSNSNKSYLYFYFDDRGSGSTETLLFWILDINRGKIFSADTVGGGNSYGTQRVLTFSQNFYQLSIDQFNTLGNYMIISGIVGGKWTVLLYSIARSNYAHPWGLNGTWITIYPQVQSGSNTFYHLDITRYFSQLVAYPESDTVRITSSSNNNNIYILPFPGEDNWKTAMENPDNWDDFNAQSFLEGNFYWHGLDSYALNVMPNPYEQPIIEYMFDSLEIYKVILLRQDYIWSVPHWSDSVSSRTLKMIPAWCPSSLENNPIYATYIAQVEGSDPLYYILTTTGYSSSSMRLSISRDLNYWYTQDLLFTINGTRVTEWLGIYFLGAYAWLIGRNTSSNLLCVGYISLFQSPERGSWTWFYRTDSNVANLKVCQGHNTLLLSCLSNSLTVSGKYYIVEGTTLNNYTINTGYMRTRNEKFMLYFPTVHCYGVVVGTAYASNKYTIKIIFITEKGSLIYEGQSLSSMYDAEWNGFDYNRGVGVLRTFDGGDYYKYVDVYLNLTSKYSYLYSYDAQATPVALWLIDHSIKSHVSINGYEFLSSSHSYTWDNNASLYFGTLRFSSKKFIDNNIPNDQIYYCNMYQANNGYSVENWASKTLFYMEDIGIVIIGTGKCWWFSNIDCNSLTKNYLTY